MLVRSLRIVHFRGVHDLQIGDLPEGSVSAVPLPAGAPPSVLPEAIRFAFLGRTAESASVLSDGSGYTWVEVGFGTPGGGAASIFRGIDRRGAHQVSLREYAGMRVASGDDAVAARLEELLGAPLAAFERATFVSASEASAAPGPDGAHAPRSPAPSADARPVERARDEVEAAIDGIRRALRVRELTASADSDYAELLDLGARLRHERRMANGDVERVLAARDRLQARESHAGELREIDARCRVGMEKRLAAAERRPEVVVALGTALCAVGFFALFLLALARPEGPEPISVGISGLGLAGSVGSLVWMWIRRRRLGPPDAWIFESAGRVEPGSGDLPEGDEARAELVRLEEEAAALQARLEQLDEATSVFEVVAGRAARSLRRPHSERRESETGLDRGETAEDAQASALVLGDRIDQARVERDALAAQGAPTPVAAAERLERALHDLGALVGDEKGAAETLHGLHVTPRTVEWLPDDALQHDLVRRLRAAADALAQRGAAQAADRTHDSAGVVTRARNNGRSASASALSGEHGTLQLEDAQRGHAAHEDLARTLREGEDALPGADSPRAIVLCARPAGFPNDAALAAFVAEHAPRATQILYGRPGG